MQNGKHLGITYHWLQSVLFKTSHQIDLMFSTHHVQIQGRHLKKLYDGLLELRVPFIQEGNEFQNKIPENEAFVSKITIKPR